MELLGAAKINCRHISWHGGWRHQAGALEVCGQACKNLRAGKTKNTNNTQLQASQGACCLSENKGPRMSGGDKADTKAKIFAVANENDIREDGLELLGEVGVGRVSVGLKWKHDAFCDVEVEPTLFGKVLENGKDIGSIPLGIVENYAGAVKQTATAEMRIGRERTSP
jgi:hypothetical protein